ncbi:hypothetical protein [Metabacillus arenae]|uniref:Uncharacterized protein n=1 Tax=Metabacillus arenae TaxID=2771434 RepID=A0A926N865_9BACI|nr:hypothetical protein [Metabacillus arenae]MBD1379192.1 hypothetical protein [Metabacillus arenae]
MTKLNWRKSEVISFIEDCLSENTATEEMEEVYYNLKWNGKVNRKSAEWKSVIREMKRLHNEGC